MSSDRFVQKIQRYETQYSDDEQTGTVLNQAGVLFDQVTGEFLGHTVDCFALEQRANLE